MKITGQQIVAGIFLFIPFVLLFLDSKIDNSKLRKYIKLLFVPWVLGISIWAFYEKEPALFVLPIVFFVFFYFSNENERERELKDDFYVDEGD